MPEKLQSLSEKILHIRSNNAEPDKQVTVKYLSEIITARIEEIMMAMLYEINESGFADMLRSGIVITGGCAQTANLGNFIYEMSGYRVRTGYTHGNFSSTCCDGTKDTTAATSIGLIMAAKEDQCVVGCTTIETGFPASGITVEEEREMPERIIDIPEFPVIPDQPEVPQMEETEKDIEEDRQPEQETEPQWEDKKEESRQKEDKGFFKVFWRKAKKVTENTKERTGDWIDKLIEEEV